MTAAVGHPTLRLVRVKIGNWSLEGIAPGEYKTTSVHLPKSALAEAPRGRKPARAPHKPDNKQTKPGAKPSGPRKPAGTRPGNKPKATAKPAAPKPAATKIIVKPSRSKPGES